MGTTFTNQLIFATLVQCLFSIIYLSTWQWERNKWLVVNFLAIFLLLLGFYLGDEKLNFWQKIIVGNPGFILVVMPSFFLFTKTLVSLPIQKKSILLHFLPALIFYLIFLFTEVSHPILFIQLFAKGDFLIVHLIHVICMVLLTVFYGNAILRLIRFNAKKYKDEYAYTNIYLNLDWLKYLCWVVLMLAFLGVLQIVFSPIIQNISLSFEFIAVLFLFSTSAISYFAFRQPTLYSKREEKSRNPINKTPDTTVKALLSSTKIEEISNRLNSYLEEEKPFLNEDIRLPEIAKALQLSRNELSWYLNEQLQVNFFTFINQHRVEYAANLLTNENFEHYTLEAISKMAGFRSKTTFNSRFKEVFKLTPSAYRKAKK